MLPRSRRSESRGQEIAAHAPRTKDATWSNQVTREWGGVGRRAGRILHACKLNGCFSGRLGVPAHTRGGSSTCPRLLAINL